MKFFWALLVILSCCRFGFGKTTGRTGLLANPQEPKCSKIPQMKNFDMRHFYGEWHLPFMSNHWIKYTSTRMTGRFQKTSSTTTFCVKTKVAPKGTVQGTNTTISLRTKFVQTNAETNLMCASKPESNNTKWYCHQQNLSDLGSQSELYIVDSDNKSWVLVVSCFPRNGISWAIFSKVKHLENKLVKNLLRKVEELGLQLWNVVEAPYEKCLHKM